MHYKDCKTNPRILTKSRTDRFGDTAAPPLLRGKRQTRKLTPQHHPSSRNEETTTKHTESSHRPTQNRAAVLDTT